MITLGIEINIIRLRVKEEPHHPFQEASQRAARFSAMRLKKSAATLI